MTKKRTQQHSELTTINDVSTNDTLLHICVKKSKNFVEFENFYGQLDPNEAAKMARTLNDHNLLPVEVKNETLNQRDRVQIDKILIDLMNQFKLDPLSTKIDEQAVLEKAAFYNNQELNNNLKFGCQLANETAEIILYSSTHPSTKDNSLSKYAIATKRTVYDARMFFNAIFYRDQIIKEGENFLLDITRKTIELTHAGNCGECARYVKYLAQKYNKQMPIYLAEIVPGDHVLAIIGSDKDNQVVVDAWSRQVYPLKQLFQNLDCLEHVTKEGLKTSVFYNDKVHTVRPDLHISKMEAYARVNATSYTLRSLGLFSAVIAGSSMLFDNSEPSSETTYYPKQL